MRLADAVRALGLATRSLARRPGFTTAAVLTYGIGIGSTVAVFSMVDGLLLKPLPFGPASERLITLHSTHPTQASGPDWDDSRLSAADLEDLRTSSWTLDGVAAVMWRSFVLPTGDESDRIRGAGVTPNLFPMIAARPAMGRLFHDEEAQDPGFENVVILSDGLWQRRFGGDPAIVGRRILANGRSLEVVGVMPRGFRFPERQDLWVPYRPDPGQARTSRHLFTFAVRRESSSLAVVQGELDALARRLGEVHPRSNRGWGMHALTFRELAVDIQTRTTLGMLFGAVLFVLLIGGANVAALLLARGAARRRELALRATLGASRFRLVAEMLAENVVVAGLGAVLGCLLAHGGLRALLASFPEELPYWIRIGVDPRALAFAVVLMLAVGIGIALLPALRAARRDPLPALVEAARGATDGAKAQRGQWTLVVGQVALSLTLLVCAQLMIRSFLALQTADSGFDESRLLAGRFYLSGDAYDPPAAKAAFLRDAIARLRALPGVADAAATSAIPTDDGGGAARAVVDGQPVAPGQEQGVTMVSVSPGFHATLGVPLVSGRAFTDAEDQIEGPPVALISQPLAERFFPAGDAVGRRVGLVSGSEIQWYTVVGVAAPVHFEELGEATAMSALNVFVPYARTTARTMAFMVRTQGPPGSVLSAVRTALRGMGPELAVYDLRTLQEIRLFTTWEQRLFGRLFGGFAVIALFLAGLGVYGLVAYSTARRTREIGIRMALGARPAHVLSAVSGQALRAGLLGLGLGAVLAFVAGQALDSILFGVSAAEPQGYLTTAAVLIAVVALAGLLPARRALRVDPSVSLRAE